MFAVFGVPIPRTNKTAIAQDAQNGVNCAIVMSQKLSMLNHQWHEQGFGTFQMRVEIWGKSYRWKFSLTCNVDDPSTNMITEGWVQRTESTSGLQTQLQSAPLREQAKLYAKEGLWYDAAATFLLLRRTQPTNQTAAKDWKIFLNSVALDESQLR